MTQPQIFVWTARCLALSGPPSRNSHLVVSRSRAVFCRIWSTRELDGWAVIWSQQSGINVPIFGWSGILDKKQSNFSLNWITSQFLMSLIFLGNALKRRAPWILRDASLNVLTLAEDLVQREGIFTSRPLVPRSLVLIQLLKLIY